jgi:hypothetical protein
MKIFERHWDPLELAFAIAGLLLSCAIILVPAHLQLAASVILLTILLLFTVHWVVRKVRTTYVLMGVRPVVNALSNLARNSTRSVWTARLNLGEGEVEDEYFHVIATRVLEGKLDEFRRLVCLSKTHGAKVHLHWLIDKLAELPAVKVRYVKSSMAFLNIAIFDGRQAIVGFPQVKGEGLSGAMYTRDPVAVKGLETVFQLLEAQGIVLFCGTKHITEEERQRIKDLIDREIDLLPADPGILHGTAEKLIDSILDQRAKGDPTVEKLTEVKLLLKGIDPSKFSGNSADDTAVIDKLNRIAADLGVRLEQNSEGD